MSDKYINSIIQLPKQKYSKIENFFSGRFWQGKSLNLMNKEHGTKCADDLENLKCDCLKEVIP